MDNANIMGIASAVHVMVSLIGFIEFVKRNRAMSIFFAISAFIGWMTLGLTGCRTGRIGVAVAVCLASFILLQEKLPVKKGRVVFSFLVAAIVGIVILLSFFLPGMIYKGTIQAIGNLFGLRLHNDLGGISLHKISDDDGTLSGRTDVWITSIKSGLKNARRFFWGISPLSAERIHGLTAGHHELRTSHAHNTYLEILRKHGILGFVTLISLVISLGVYCLKILFSKEKNVMSICMVSLIAASLLMGMVEPFPLVNAHENVTSLLFFMAFGYCMQTGRAEQ